MPKQPGPRARRPTLADVAAAAGVSVPLVSIVMRDAQGASATTRDRVRKVAEDLGYRPDQRARLLRQQRTRLLGVSFDVEQAFHGDLIGGIYAVAEPAGYDVVLSATGPTRPEARAVDALLDDRCEAVILLGPQSATRSLTALATKLPVVVLARIVRSAAVDTVRTDDHAGMNAAIGHLVDLGHRRIAYLDGGRTPGAPERLHALNEAATARLSADGVRIIPGGPGEEDGVGAVEHLLANGPLPTAVVAFNDRCAIGAIGALNRAGLQVPQDVSVVGYDDSRLARISYIDLTTVGQNPRQLADLAVHRAIDRLEDHRVERRDQVVTPQFVIRSSTAPPRD